MKPDPQNVYEDPQFFAGYRDLRQNDTGLNGAMEVPALCAALPDLAGKSVLDLGCGFGDFARYARRAGAASVVAIDLSARMLAEAGRLTNDAAITYLRCAIEAYQPASHSFDVAVSSLALHYVDDYAGVLLTVRRALKPGGWWVFSVEHPVCTAEPSDWTRDASGARASWPLDRYQDEGPRLTSWFIEGVTKYHRTVSRYVNALTAAGFRIERLDEPGPTAQALAQRPSLRHEQRRPPFLLVAASRP